MKLNLFQTSEIKLVMNIFFLYLSPSSCAKAYCDKHVIKIILEITQMAWTAYHITGDDGWQNTVPKSLKIYRKTHANHPMTVWVRSHPNNFRWAIRHGIALCIEYSKRYRCKCSAKRIYDCSTCVQPKKHACQDALVWMFYNRPRCDDTSPTKAVYAETAPKGCTPVPLCISNPEYRSLDLVESYRRYYIGEKLEIAVWSNTNAPRWVRDVKSVTSS